MEAILCCLPWLCFLIIFLFGLFSQKAKLQVIALWVFELLFQTNLSNLFLVVAVIIMFVEKLCGPPQVTHTWRLPLFSANRSTEYFLCCSQRYLSVLENSTHMECMYLHDLLQTFSKITQQTSEALVTAKPYCAFLFTWTMTRFVWNWAH